MVVDIADIEEQAREVIGRTFGLADADLADTVSAAALPVWDSLHHFTLIVALEDRFGVSYTSDEIPTMSSLEAITQVTARHLQVEER